VFMFLCVRIYVCVCVCSCICACVSVHDTACASTYEIYQCLSVCVDGNVNAILHICEEIVYVTRKVYTSDGFRIQRT